MSQMKWKHNFFNLALFIDFFFILYSQVRFAGTVRWDPLSDPEWIEKLTGTVLYPDPEISNYYPPECAYFFVFFIF